MGELQATYLYHSAFSVELDDTLLVFDYIQAPEAEGKDSQGTLNREALAKYKQVVVLVTHSHGDHFDPVIFDWAEANRVRYVLSYDIPLKWPGRRLKPGERAAVGEVTVEAYDSTDIGVSFLVKLGDYTVFHAGDLNLWHWREVSTLREIEQAERDFHAAVRPLQGKEIDLAFFPVDPRQGSLYDAGANYFVMAVKPRVLIPMHWQERVDVAQEYVRKNRTRRVEMVALTRPGDVVVIGKRFDRAGDDAPKWHYQTITRSILDERENVESTEGEET